MMVKMKYRYPDLYFWPDPTGAWADILFCTTVHISGRFGWNQSSSTPNFFFKKDGDKKKKKITYTHIWKKTYAHIL